MCQKRGLFLKKMANESLHLVIGLTQLAKTFDLRDPSYEFVLSKDEAIELSGAVQEGRKLTLKNHGIRVDGSRQLIYHNSWECYNFSDVKKYMTENYKLPEVKRQNFSANNKYEEGVTARRPRNYCNGFASARA